MFFFRHPKPIIDGRAVAVQVVQQKATQAVSRTVLIVETPPASAGQPEASHPAPAQDAC
ncbi:MULTISPECIES: hypothetical protein [unclassified Massilia]|uniref:hypothetical protein n=1 Tax=unclassified Massilia TaxID=2609279 RepID=UPI00177B0041|nr:MULTISPECIES: hypothetical protein [unclassified Massilia]MBD8532450.1 hypothetical protein [Massilia sp. CFBP 13647]MBD8675820.1 hypothetical protein [Massilia sp. CFBP 13721]